MPADYRQYPFAQGRHPRGWAETTVGQVLLGIQSGFSSGKHNQTGDGIPHLRPMSVSPLGEITLEGVRYIAADAGILRLAEDDVLFTNTSSTVWVGKTAVIRNPGDWAFSNHMTRLRVGTGMDPEFVARQLHYLCMCGYFAFHCKKHINQSSIAGGQLADDVPFRCPPAKEQTRITSKLTRLLKRERNVREALETLPALMQEYRAAVLEAACTGRLVPTEAELARKEHREYETASVLLERILHERRAKWEADQLAKMRAAGKKPRDDKWKVKYPEPLQPNQVPDDALPRGWTWASFDQLATRVTVGYVGPMRTSYVKSGIPFLRSQNVRLNRFEPEGLLHITRAFHEKLIKSKVLPGDLAVVRSGSVGVTCVIPKELGEANCADLVLIQQPLGFVSQFGAYFLNSLGRKHVEEGKVGVALTHFNTRSVATMPVALPPFAEQKRIVAEVEKRFSAFARIENEVLNASEQTSHLRASLFHRALSGHMVDQSASDVSALELLAQIKHEKWTRAQEAKGWRKPRTPKKETLPMLTLEDIKPTHLSDILRQHERPLDARSLWKESQLSIDDFYAQLKSELGKGITETEQARLLEAKA